MARAAVLGAVLLAATPLASARLTDAYFTELVAMLDSQVPSAASNNAQNDANADYFGGVVRLSFHDAASYCPTCAWKGGADACLDWTDPEHAGLQSDVTASGENLDGLYAGHTFADTTPLSDVISLADFYHVAAWHALRESLERDGRGSFTLPMDIRFGRTTAASCQVDLDGVAGNDEIGRMPDASLALGEIERVFVDRLGYTHREITALMGAHTLGRVKLANSGFQGAAGTDSGVWVAQDAALNGGGGGGYYDVMVNRPWNRVTSEAGKPQWIEPNQGTMMLNTDMALAFEIGSDATVNTETCQVGGGAKTLGQCDAGPGNRCDCDAADVPTAPFVFEYIASQEAWLADFGPAMQKMTEFGWDEGTLYCVEGSCLHAFYCTLPGDLGANIEGVCTPNATLIEDATCAVGCAPGYEPSAAAATTVYACDAALGLVPATLACVAAAPTAAPSEHPSLEPTASQSPTPDPSAPPSTYPTASHAPSASAAPPGADGDGSDSTFPQIGDLGEDTNTAVWAAILVAGGGLMLAAGALGFVSAAGGAAGLAGAGAVQPGTVAV